MRSNFLTTCTNSYTRKKVASRSQLYADTKGRSMVEMLGVLAIIGVLSIGAIAGYGKAMMKYRLNKYSEQMNTLINASIRYYSQLSLKQDGVPEYNLGYLLNKLGEIPQEMIRGGVTTGIYDVFGNKVVIYYHDTGYLGILSRIDKSGQSMEVCRTAIITAKENHAYINSIFFRNDYSDKIEWSYASAIRGDKICKNDTICLKDMTMKQIDEACKFCATDRCLMYITFKG